MALEWADLCIVLIRLIGLTKLLDEMGGGMKISKINKWLNKIANNNNNNSVVLYIMCNNSKNHLLKRYHKNNKDEDTRNINSWNNEGI